MSAARSFRPCGLGRRSPQMVARSRASHSRSDRDHNIRHSGALEFYHNIRQPVQRLLATDAGMLRKGRSGALLLPNCTPPKKPSSCHSSQCSVSSTELSDHIQRHFLSSPPSSRFLLHTSLCSRSLHCLSTLRKYSTFSIISGSSTGPFPDGEVLEFQGCKNPIQLEKSIASYLKSHPEPTERALVAMLTACADLVKSASFPDRKKYEPHKKEQHHPSQKREEKRGSGIGGMNVAGAKRDLGSNLLQTILASSMFTSEDVFKIACSIYHYAASTESYPGLDKLQQESSSSSSSSPADEFYHTKSPSITVTNAFLQVCAVTGQFDKAWSIMEDMMHRAQGDVKPDLATYRWVLRTASTRRRQLQGQPSSDISDLDNKVEKLLDFATEALARQARLALSIKLAIGGLAGATVAKFTMLGIIALPSSSIFKHSTSLAIDPTHPAEGIIHLLASQEVAMGVGLGVGLMTAGYFIRGSTRQPREQPEVSEEHGSKPKPHHHVSHSLPRAKLFGLYFPDLATTNKKEIREHLKRIIEA